MSRFIPAPERIQRARLLIQKARDHPIPLEGGRFDFSYVAQVKAFLQEARDLVKFLSRNPGISSEIKAEAARIFEEADLANRELLH